MSDVLGNDQFLDNVTLVTFPSYQDSNAVLSTLFPVCVKPKPPNSIQLFRERLSEKVHATIPEGIVDGF